MGITVRSGPLSDPDVQSLIAERFVPVAIDVGSVRRNWRFEPAGTPNYVARDAGAEEVTLFAAIDRQAPMSQGIWLTTPEGKVLRTSYHVVPAPLVDLMRLAVAEWESDGARSPSPLPPRTKTAKLTGDGCDGPVRLAFYGRLLDGSDAQPFRDSADFSMEQWMGLLPEEIIPGSSVAVPDEILQAFATRLYPGEMRLAVRPEEIEHAEATVSIAQIEDGIARAKLQGRIDIDGVFPSTTRRRMLQTSLTGELAWRTDTRRLMALRIVSDGTWQGEYSPGILPTTADIYPGGMSLGRPVMTSPMRMLFLIEYSPSELGDRGLSALSRSAPLARDD